ncbi:MAG: MAPEG family protein [Legionella sp.]|nr:MAPEG family protein [Legionella sp.]
MNTIIICLLIAVLLPYAVRMIVAYHMGKEGQYDNNLPRAQQSRLTGIGARAVAAHQNGFESLLVFATAALTALTTQHVGTTIQYLAITYIVSRIVYNVLYLLDKASLRSVIWLIGFACSLIILVLCLY